MIASFQKSLQQTFELLNHPNLGEGRPSVLKDHMLALLLEHVEPNHIFLTLLLHHLSANMSDQLAARTSSCLWPWQRRPTAFLMLSLRASWLFLLSLQSLLMNPFPFPPPGGGHPATGGGTSRPGANPGTLRTAMAAGMSSARITSIVVAKPRGVASPVIAWEMGLPLAASSKRCSGKTSLRDSLSGTEFLGAGAAITMLSHSVHPNSPLLLHRRHLPHLH